MNGSASLISNLKLESWTSRGVSALWVGFKFCPFNCILFLLNAVPSFAAKASPDVPISSWHDLIIPLANMGIGAVIAVLLIWQIFPILNRNTETLREIAATLDAVSENNLRVAEKLIDIIEKQALIRGGNPE